MASSGTADHSDLKSLRLAGASPAAPTSARGSTGIADRFGSKPNSLGSALRFAKRTSFVGKLTCKTWEVHSPRADQLECQPDKPAGTACLADRSLGVVVLAHGI